MTSNSLRSESDFGSGTSLWCRPGWLRRDLPTWLMLLSLLIMAANSVAVQTIATEGGAVRQVPRLVALLLAVAAIGVARMRPDRMFVALAAAAVGGALLGGNSDQISFVYAAVMAVALMTVPLRRATTVVAIASALALALIFLFLVVGLTEDRVIEWRERRTFGVASVPYLYNVVYGALGMFRLWSVRLALRWRLVGVVVTLGLATWFFLETDARAGYLSYLALTVLLLVPTVVWRNRVVQTCLALLPVAFLVGALGLASQSGNAQANTIFSNRPILFNMFLESLSPWDVLLSRSVKALDQGNIVDNSYLHLAVGGGIVVCALVLVIHFRALPALIRAGHHREVALMVSLALYFNMESILVRLDQVFIIFYWYLLALGWRLHSTSGREPTAAVGESMSHGSLSPDTASTAPNPEPGEISRQVSPREP